MEESTMMIRIGKRIGNTTMKVVDSVGEWLASIFGITDSWAQDVVDDHDSKQLDQQIEQRERDRSDGIKLDQLESQNVKV